LHEFALFLAHLHFFIYSTLVISTISVPRGTISVLIEGSNPLVPFRDSRAMLWLFLHLHSQPALLLVSLQLLRDLPDDLLRRCHRTIATIAARQRLLHRIDNADAAIPESPYVLRRDFLPRATHSQPSPLAPGVAGTHLVPHIRVHRRRHEAAHGALRSWPRGIQRVGAHKGRLTAYRPYLAASGAANSSSRS